MTKNSTRLFYSLIFCFSVGLGLAQVNTPSIPEFGNGPQRNASEVMTNPDGSMRIRGVIQHQDEPGHNKGKAVMVADLPADKVKKACWFFGGDSLSGFDFEAAAKQAEKEGDKMYMEFRAFMFRTQAAYVKNKYGISKLPFEIAMENARNVPPGVQVSSCSNMDFENGDFSSWVGASGINQNSNAFLTAQGGAVYATNGNIYNCADLQLISSAYGNDPAGNFPGLDPNGGNWSARLGGMYINEAAGYDGGACNGSHWSNSYSNGEYILQTFTVSASNALISFDYAVILNDGGHPNGQQPYFHVYVTNSSGAVLNATCTEYYVQASAGSAPAGFSTSSLKNPNDLSTIYYQGWKSGSINLTPYIGQQVNLYFIAAGCTNGGHPGWAYVDATCGTASIAIANPNPCTGSTTTMTAPPVYGGSYAWSGPGIVGSTTSQVITVNASGTYTCVVTPPQGNSCKYTLTQSVTFITSPTAAPAAAPASLCSGATTTLTANATNATSYSWSPGGSTASSFTVTPPVGTTVYSLTVTNGGNCPVVKTTTVTVTASPTLTVSGTTSICSGNSTTLTGSGATSYSWQPFGSTGTSISVNPSSTTSYTLIGANGSCSTSTVVTVNVTTTPTITISGTSSICSGQSTVLTGGTASNYTWLPGGSSASTITVSPTSNTTYTLTGANGSCSANKTITVTVTPTPTLNISGASSICSGSSVVLTGATATNYTWMPGSINTNTISVTPGSTTTYTLTGANGTCTASTTAQVTVTATPTVNISGASSICSGSSVVLTGGTASNYTWLPGGSTASTITVTPGSTTTYTLTGANGTCTASTTAQVTVTATPTLNITGTNSICSGQSTVLTGSTASNYTWMPGSVNTNTISVTPSSTTVYTLTGANGSCSANKTYTVTVTATPTVNISGASAICSGSSVVLTGGTASNYTWLPGGSTASTITVTPGSTTTYTLTGANGTCTATTTAQVTVTATPTLSITGANNLCSGQSTVLTGSTASNYTWMPGSVNTSTISVTPSSTTVYTLTGANGSCVVNKTYTVNVTTTPTVNISGAAPICSGSSVVLTGGTATNYTWLPGGSTASTITVTPGSTTTYTLTGANGTCTASATAAVNVTPTPTMNISGAGPICSGSSITLNGGTATNYTWSPSGGNGSSATVTPASTTVYTLTGANGTCTASATASVSVTPTPTINISGAAAICSGQSVTLNGGTATNYTWSPSGGNGASATVSPSSSTTYTLTGANGTCTASAVAGVTVTPTPTLNITGAAAICDGNGVTLNGATATNYTWSPGNQNTSSISVSPSSTTAYTLTGANGTCTATAVATVTVNPLPVIGTASITSAPCGQSTGCINSVSVSGGTPTYTYSWNGGAGSTSSQYCNQPAGTYVLVVTDASGCQATQNFSIPSSSGPAAPQVAPTSTASCIGDTVVLNISPVVGGITYTWTDNTGTHTGTTYTINNIGPAGNYNISVTATDNNGCVSTATTMSIDVNPLPVINTSASPNTICNGQSTVLNASGATSYTWSTNAGSAQTNTVSVSPTSSDTYTVTGSDLGCVSTQTVAVTVNPLPVVTASAGPDTICNGQSTVLTAGGATTYTWSTSASTQTVSVSPTANTTYTVTGDVLGCTSTQTVLVNVTPLPNITATPAPPSLCVGQSTVISAGGATTYTWSSNAGGGSATTVTVSPTTTTTYTLAGTQNGCSDSTTVTVSIGVPPSITVAASSTVMCSGGSTTLTATGATSYTWMPGSLSGGTVTVSPSSNTVYTVSATAGGCPTVDTIAVNVTPTPTINATASAGNICSGATTTLTVSGSTSYTWSPGNATGDTISVTPNVTTTYTVVSDSAGCTSQQQVTVNVTTTPTVSAVSTASVICSTQSATLTANGATTYSWTPGGAGGSITVTPTGNTTYTVVGMNGNCSDTTTINLGVTPTPTLSVAATGTAVCAGQTATLTASGATNYTWMPNGVSNDTLTDAPQNTTTYTVTGDNAGCTSTQQITVVVNQLPTLTTVGNQTVCSGSPVNAINYSSGGATVNWTNTNGNVGIATSGSGNIAGYTAPNVSNTETGVITATPVDNGTGCQGVAQSYTVIINPTPQATGGNVDSALCGNANGGVTGINVTGGTPGYTYQWYDNGVLMPGETNPTLSNVGMGTYNVVITDANGCTVPASSSTYTVNGSVAVNAGFTASTYTGQAPLAVTFSNTTTGATGYSWTLGNGISTQQNPSTSYDAMGTYTVILTATNGSCIDTAMAVVVVDAATSIVIPNIYSPNGDGVNDVFMIMCTGMRSLKCDIFNRWGQLVYRLNGPNDVWDGTMLNGNAASEGTYFYILDAEGYDNKSYKKEGALTLVK